MTKLYSFIILSFFGSTLLAQPHWETIVNANQTWSYLIGDAEAPSGWYDKDFDDAGWTFARGSFGFGDGDDTTELNIPYSLYIRHSFQVTDAGTIDSLILDIDFDDAFVAYLNGSAVARSFNVGTDFPPYNYTPAVDQEARMYQGYLPTRVTVPTSHLVDGENVLAIQGINMNPTSSDFSLAPFLQGRVDAATIQYEQVPDWFVDPDAPFESNLPLVIIETENGAAIPDDPKITAHLGIVDNPSGTNTYPGTYNGYDGFIGIELRGSTANLFEKKSYGIETRLENGENNNVPILGMPPENDWILHGPYSDKSLIRNVLAYHFSREMGRYAPRTRLCELFVNDSYRGVYLWTEKVKKDTFRVDVGTLNPDEVSGRDLTGGYMFKLDKGDEDYWVSPYPAIDNNPIRILYYYPDHELMPAVQKAYIRDFVTAFENALAGTRFYDPVAGYKPYIDMQSFVDFYIVNELAKNVDAYRISTYLYKDKDKKDHVSPIVAGPLWDFNLGFGNADYYDASVTSGWENELKLPDDYWSTPFWWARLKKDPDYFNLLVDSWTAYRSSILSDQRVDQVIDSLTTLLADAQQRNFNAFPVLTQYVWPNNYVGGTYDNEISYLKNWIHERMAWMDDKLDYHMYPYSIPGSIHAEDLMARIYPNPIDEEFSLLVTVDKPSVLRIEIYNALGQQTYGTVRESYQGTEPLVFDQAAVRQAMPRSGIYFIRFYLDGSFAGAKKVVKQ